MNYRHQVWQTANGLKNAEDMFEELRGHLVEFTELMSALDRLLAQHRKEGILYDPREALAQVTALVYMTKFPIEPSISFADELESL